MALLDLTAAAPRGRSTDPDQVEQGHHPHGHSLGEVLRRVGVSLLVACVVPAAVFYAAFVTVGVWPAIGAALGWSYAAIAFRALTGRRTSGLLLLTAGVLTVRTVVTLLSQSTFVYFLQPVLSDLVVGTAFLVSTLTARPLVARLAGDFYPLDDEVAARPAMRTLFRRLTLLWAVVSLAKAMGLFWLLTSQPLDTFVLVRSVSLPTANLVTIALTVLAAAAVARREGLIGRGPAILRAWSSPTPHIR